MPSSGEWSGAADIIDLDRYMRGSVRPHRPDHLHKLRLVVDGGAGAGASECAVVSECAGVSSRSSASGDARFKRASHDSGVSDGSYPPGPRPRTVHHYRRHLSRPLGPAPGAPLDAPSSSLHAFRTVCQQALLDQQRQIARVTELCEKLAEKSERAERPTVERNEQTEREVERAPRARSKRSERSRVRASDASSDLSSSSHSTRDLRPNAHRYQAECKTYKIIMSKLDELGRVFARPAAAPHAPRTPRAPSASSVSVCDKLVATDPQRTYNKILAPSYQRARPAGGRSVTRAYTVDIAPRTPRHRTNVITESVNKCESMSGSSRASACEPRRGFDLADPVHVYSQAKRIRTLSASSRRARSAESAARERAWLGERVGEHVGERAGRARSASLCAVCRGYWRCLRRCVPPLADSCKCS